MADRLLYSFIELIMSAVAVILKKLKFVIRICLLNLRFFAAFNQRAAARYKAVGRAYYLKGIVKYFARCYSGPEFRPVRQFFNIFAQLAYQNKMDGF